MARVLVYIIIVAFFAPPFLKADDRGFRFTPSFTSMAGLVDNKLSLKTAVQAEMTYLIFNQLEFGVGAGYQRQRMTQSKDIDFYLSNGDRNTFSIPSTTSNSLPYYGILRYNFDLFEDGFFVAAIKYGAYYLIPKDKLQKGFLPSTPEAEGEQAPILRYENNITDMSFLAVTLGYDLSDTVISLEYRMINFNQNVAYINEKTQQIVENSYKKTNYYIGLNVAYKIDLF